MADALPVLFSFGGTAGGPRIEVTAAEDGMTAWATFFSASEAAGKQLVWTEFAEVLQNAGLTGGVFERELQEALFRFNTSHPSAERVVLARGKPAQAERPAFLKLEPRFFNHHFQDMGGVQVDHKEYSPFVIVKQGELLARAILPREGVPGYTVYSAEIPAGKKDIKHIKPGPHTLFAHGKVFARIAGRFTLEGDVFDVSDTLELDAGVGYGTGNLVFPGTLIVKGVVSDGFRLASGGDMVVKGPLDASEVLCHGNLSCEGGIIGKKPGVVRVGGDLKALYIEHCQVEALGSLSVSKALLHAKVYSNADLKMDDGGRVVASTVWVKNSLRCAQLGGENGPVKIVAGSDFVVHRKLEVLRAKHTHREDELKKEGLPPEGAAELEAIVQEMNTLNTQLFSNPACEVTATARVFEGTVIEMGFASLTVTKPLKGQVFKLSSDGKTIVASPLGKEGAAPAADAAAEGDGASDEKA